MSSGDPLVFFLVLVIFLPRLTAVFFFFHQILNCLLYFIVFACAFFSFCFLQHKFSIFHSTCHCINISLFVFIYMSIVRHKYHNIPCIKEMNSISYL